MFMFFVLKICVVLQYKTTKNIYTMEAQKLNFSTVYNENRTNVFYQILSKVHDKQATEEICNDVFLKVFKHLDNFDGKKAQLSSWIYGISKNTMIDYFRKQVIERKYMKVSDLVDNENKEAFQFISNSPEADKNILNDELKVEIDKAFETLDVENKRIAILFFLYEYEYQEIADILNVPLGTVKGMIFRVRAILKKKLKGLHKSNKRAMSTIETE